MHPKSGAIKKLPRLIWRIALLGALPVVILAFLAPRMPDFPGLIQFLPALAWPMVLYFGLLSATARWLRIGKSAWLSLGALFLSLYMGSRDLSFHLPDKSSEPALRVLSYNARNFNFDGDNVPGTAAWMAGLQPDIVCIQEFRNYLTPSGATALNAMARKLKLPYRMAMPSGQYLQGVAILSRYPVIRWDTLYSWPAEAANGGLMATLRLPGGDTLCAGVLHLSSFHITSLDPAENRLRPRLWRILNGTSAKIALHHKSLSRTIKKTNALHHPLILAADLNSVAHTSAGAMMRRHYADAFRSAGSGFGWTYPLPFLGGIRIDYQWHKGNIEPLSLHTLEMGDSDHWPLLGAYRIVR